MQLVNPPTWLLLIALCSGCGAPRATDSAACHDGSDHCAAADAPAGMRGVRRGHRLREARWRATTNRESGHADIGLEAVWETISERD